MCLALKRRTHHIRRKRVRIFSFELLALEITRKRAFSILVIL
jgi:hypothetical protein